MAKEKNRFTYLMESNNSEGLSTDDALPVIAELTDLSFDLRKPEGIERSIQLNSELQKRNLTLKQASVSHYYLANAYANKGQLEKLGTEKDWQWEHQYLEKEIFHLRNALQVGKNILTDEYICPIMTNLANCLNKIGRFIEAIEYWDKVLKINPDFSMAIGNRGLGLVHYSQALYDEGHAHVFLRFAFPALKEASENEGIHKEAKGIFQVYKKSIERYFEPNSLEKDPDLNSFSKGQTDDEIRYRNWCLENRLFLNPLNDLGSFSIANQDVLLLPSIVVESGEGPYYIGFYNQMKQEFVSARYLYYEAINSKPSHFADKGVLLANTMDYPSYSLAVEKMKSAYRMAYSILDKIAFFLNHYLNQSIAEHRVSFKTIWYRSQKRDKGLRDEFIDLKNWPMRGLFWLSKDLFEDKPGFKDSLEPEASELNDIRNHLEHKYLKLHDDMWVGPPNDDDKISKALADTLAFSLYRDDFEKKTLTILKMARAALIYLSLGIETEERRKASERGKGEFVAPMFLDIFEDEWKF